jgi:hypothetical protein
MDFEKKYLKYKEKYLELKKNKSIIGGNFNLHALKTAFASGFFDSNIPLGEELLKAHLHSIVGNPFNKQNNELLNRYAERFSQRDSKFLINMYLLYNVRKVSDNSFIFVNDHHFDDMRRFYELDLDDIQREVKALDDAGYNLREYKMEVRGYEGKYYLLDFQITLLTYFKKVYTAYFKERDSMKQKLAKFEANIQGLIELGFKSDKIILDKDDFWAVKGILD